MNFIATAKFVRTAVRKAGAALDNVHFRATPREAVQICAATVPSQKGDRSTLLFARFVLESHNHAVLLCFLCSPTIGFSV